MKGEHARTVTERQVDDMGHIAILGSGMAGFGASHQLRAEGLDTVLYEKFAHLGGQTVSQIGRASCRERVCYAV